MAVIKIFEKGTKSFKTNGLAVIHPLELFESKETSLNGWSIYSKVPISSNSLIIEGRIAYVETKSKGGQAFVISNPIRNKDYIEFQALHIAFDSANYILGDVRPTDLSAQSALTYVNERTDINSPFSMTSNLANSQTAYFINKTLLEALVTIEERWGGTFDLDNYKISLLNNVGLDRGYSIMYGKNLEGLSHFEDWSNVVTKLKPVGFDGITLPEQYIFSDIDYGKAYSKVIKFETDLEEEDRTTENLINELRSKATDYLDEHQYPKMSYEIESNVYQELEIGDLVKVKHPIVNIHMNVISYEYNILSKRTTKVVFGNYRRDVKSKVGAIKDSIAEVIERTSGIENIMHEQTDLINSMNKNGHVYRDENQILIMDKIPKELAKQVWRWNFGGLGYSENGVEGPYKQAWTMDGKFNTEFISANSIMTNQLNSDVGSSLDLSSNKSLQLIVEDIETMPGPSGESAYYAQIIASNGNIFRNGVISTELHAIVFYGSDNITEYLDANCFNWKRVSADTEADIIWNQVNAGGKKIIEITSEDVYLRASFSCEINIELADILLSKGGII